MLRGTWVELFVMSFGLRGEQSVENEISDSLLVYLHQP